MKYTLLRLGYVPYFRKKKCVFFTYTSHFNYYAVRTVTKSQLFKLSSEYSTHISHFYPKNSRALTSLCSKPSRAHTSLSSRLDRFRQAALVSHLSTAVRIFECPGYSLCNVKCFFHGYVRATRLVMLTYNFNCYDASFSECWQVYLF